MTRFQSLRKKIEEYEHTKTLGDTDMDKIN